MARVATNAIGVSAGYRVLNSVTIRGSVVSGGGGRMTVTTTTLGERGLIRLPAAVRDEAGLEKGDEIIVIAAGPGRIVLTTRSSIQDEIWAAAPPGDRATDMRAERDRDNLAVAGKRHRARARAEASTDDDAERIGTSLLRRLGG
jgi:bifunctional DNA-binding transcriptional regulator/antitoxin component of YhaV-PrlF toxin-antitoxin module